MKSERDKGMAYGLKLLVKEGYERILAVTGSSHLFGIEGYLKDKKLEEKFMKSYKEKRVYNKRGLTIQEPFGLNKIKFIPYYEI